MASASSAAGGAELPRELLGAMHRQFELMQEILEHEQHLQRELAGRAAAPFDAIFDLPAVRDTGPAVRANHCHAARAGRREVAKAAAGGSLVMQGELAYQARSRNDPS